MIPIIGDAIGLIKGVIDKIFPDKTKALEAKAKIDELQASGELAEIVGQYGLAITEAAHRSVFVAGWRPSIGWICSISLGLVWIPQFALGSYFWIVECFKVHHLVAYSISISELLCMIATLLPNATLRTFEKIKGVTR